MRGDIDITPHRKIRFALGAAQAGLRLFAGDADLHFEAWRVIRAFASDQLVDWRVLVALARLRPFLQHGLGIAHVGAKRCEGVRPIEVHEAPRRFHAAVEIKRRDHRLAGARQNRRLVPPAAARFRVRQDDVLGEACGFGGDGAGFAPRQGVELERQRSFGIVRVKRVQPFGADQSEYAVAQELQALVGGIGVGAGMSQSALQKRPVRENMSESRFQISRWA